MKHNYQISGMTCMGCRAHVENSLKNVEGVTNAKVDLEKASAEIEMEKHIELEKFQAALEDSNYEIYLADEVLQTYSVSGMTCKGCSAHVEATLNKVEGVNRAKVNLEKAEAKVFSEENIPLEKLQQALQDDGGHYQIHELGEEVKPKKKKPKGEGTGVFYCPMHCEGDKTYDKPGDCPVCGMDLVEEASLKPQATTYTCPMHPEVEQDGPGSCPKCGMDLVPKEPEESSESKSYKKLLKKFKIAVAFTLPIFIIAMSEMISDNPLYEILDQQYWN